jgi:hypothetical protein
MKPVFNYDKITDDQKEAAQEIVEFLEGSGNNLIADVIAEKFKLTPPNRYPIADIEVFKKFEELRMPVTVQGYSKENNVEYQIVNVIADVRVWEKFWETINNANS